MNTEEEAKLIKCFGERNSVYCCASRCMAWRWDKSTQQENVSEVVGNDVVVATTHFSKDEWRGYCGLAGIP